MQFRCNSRDLVGWSLLGGIGRESHIPPLTKVDERACKISSYFPFLSIPSHQTESIKTPLYIISQRTQIINANI